MPRSREPSTSRSTPRPHSSSYLYMSMAAWFQGQQLNGFAHWFKIQTQKELTHSVRFYNYVYDRDGKVR